MSRRTLPEIIERICEYCGRSFQAPSKKVWQGKGRFCSRACMARAVHCKPVAERFYARTERPADPEACWRWTGDTNARWGYGVMSVHGRGVRVNRLTYELHKGSIPDGLLVCHTCDNRLCVNPNHLHLGTHRDNAHDKFKSNTQAKKLTPDAVRSIRIMAAQGMVQRKIAAHFSVSHITIGKILRRQIWAHVP